MLISRNDANALIPVEVASDIVSAAASSSVALQMLARLPDMSAKQRRLPVVSSFPVAGFVSGDTGLKPVSGVVWGEKMLEVEEIAVIIPVPEAVVADAEYDIWAQIQPLVGDAFAAVIDNAIFFGIDAPPTWPKGLIPLAEDYENTVSAGSLDIADDINRCMSVVETLGYDVSGFVAHAGLKASLRSLRDTQNGYLYQPADSTVYGLPLLHAKNWDPQRAALLAGDFSKAVYAIRQDLTYKLLDQGVISSPDGNIVYNLAQQDMVALRCVMRLAWQVAATDTLPFAVLSA